MQATTRVLQSNAALLMRRLEQQTLLDPGESLALEELGWELRTVPRRQTLITEGAKIPFVYFVVDGFLLRYRILHDGRRQVVDLIIPGNFADVPSCFFKTALFSIKTLTEATLAAIPLSRLVRLFDTHPALAAKIFWSFSCSTAAHTEHLVAVGRRPASERVAHFLLELLVRLQNVGLADERSFELPTSQEVIGDALGLSVAYVNCVFRRLMDDDLVTISGRRVVINDVAELSALVDFEGGYLKPLPMSAFAD